MDRAQSGCQEMTIEAGKGRVVGPNACLPACHARRRHRSIPSEKSTNESSKEGLPIALQPFRGWNYVKAYGKNLLSVRGLEVMQLTWLFD
jgi:hypothetical protein